MASRSITDLHPDLQPICREFIHRCEMEGFDVLVYCTYRSGDEQDALYAIGRTKPGKKVTNARAGQSKHNFTINGRPASKAWDSAPMQGGKIIWDAKHPYYAIMGRIGMELGLNWYGAPGSKFKEYVHFEMRG